MSDVDRSGCSEDESCSTVLYLFEFRKKILQGNTTNLHTLLQVESSAPGSRWPYLPRNFSKATQIS